MSYITDVVVVANRHYGQSHEQFVAAMQEAYEADGQRWWFAHDEAEMGGTKGGGTVDIFTSSINYCDEELLLAWINGIAARCHASLTVHIEAESEPVSAYTIRYDYAKQDAAERSATYREAESRRFTLTPSEADAAIQRVHDLHQPFFFNGMELACAECGVRYPCPTVKALDGAK